MLDELPVASIVFIASVVLIIIAFISNEIQFEQAFEALGFAGAASFGIGYVRNQAGRGLRK